MKKVLFLMFCFFSSFSLFSTEEKIALLFITRSDLNQTHVWHDWIDPKLCNVYNHSKVPSSDPWFSQFRIKDIQPNEWGFILLAERALLRTALENPENSYFIFLSESCIPLRPCREVHRILTSEGQSHMRWHNMWWKEGEPRTLTEFPLEHRYGNHTWYILNRKHAQMMADDDYWIHIAMRHVICDEAYPSTFFSMCGVIDEFKNELTTYVDWSRGGAGPYTFHNDSKDNYKQLIKAKHCTTCPCGPCCCLFARKVSKEFPAQTIKQVIQHKKHRH